MFKSLSLNRAFGTLLSIAIGYVVLFNVASMDNLIIFLNGVFVGTMAAIIVAFSPLIRDVFKGSTVFTKVEQMALGILVLVMAINVLAMNSIYFRTIGIDLPTTPVTALGRYLSNCALILIITAPDYDQGFFYGRDRRLLWASITVGTIAALVIVLMQLDLNYV